ncbi:Vta1 like-domain-containing protein [Cyathus striatus]|nr:Vta1 like-domain-containing protein [Cyathus striatus]
MPPQLLGLPPISPELKPITPYLQRAEELKSQDPIIAYWCAYYAAQVGISLKARDTAARDLLFSLLGVLERMKQEIGPSDAVDIEAASAAYVENFALKVFTIADNEDRSGRAARSTAKKFLAAANFLEVLKTFPKTEVQESNEEKIRYAKWKAVDIAKAFHEGRKPAPGPAGSEMEPDQQTLSPSVLVNTNSSSTTLVAGSPPKGRIKLSGFPPSTEIISSSPPRHDDVSRSGRRDSPSHPQIDPADIARANINAPSRRKGLNDEVDGHLSVGDTEGPTDNWSTAATPGTAHGNTPLTEEPNPHEQNYTIDQSLPTKDPGQTDRIASTSSSPIDNARLRKGSVDGQPEGHLTPPASSSPPKKVTFTPSIVGGSTASTSPASDLLSHSNITPSTTPTTSSYPIPTSPLPPPINDSIYGPSSSPRSNIYGSPSTSTPRTNIYAPPPTLRTNIYAPPVPAPASVAAPPPFELTPTVIAKAQKHCRFAISALDYEDPETARKELRAALNMLGG